MSQVLHVVVWRDPATGKDYIPVDNEYFEHNEPSAKEAARDLLVPLRASKLTPSGVMPIHASDRDKLTGAPVKEFGTPPVRFKELGVRKS